MILLYMYSYRLKSGKNKLDIFFKYKNNRLKIFRVRSCYFCIMSYSVSVGSCCVFIYDICWKEGPHIPLSIHISFFFSLRLSLSLYLCGVFLSPPKCIILNFTKPINTKKKGTHAYKQRDIRGTTTTTTTTFGHQSEFVLNSL